MVLPFITITKNLEILNFIFIIIFIRVMLLVKLI